jgi:hypothetical protein
MRATLAVCLGLGSLVSQAQTSVARIYIQTPQGVDLYTLSTANKLSLVSGSPFKTVGLGAGTNGSCRRAIHSVRLLTPPPPCLTILGTRAGTPHGSQN